MKILVTGGAGFIGSHLVELLIKKKFKVFIVDNEYSGKIKNIKKHKNITIIKKDISSIPVNINMNAQGIIKVTYRF